MTVCRFAELTVGFCHRYPYFARAVRDYTVEDAEPTITISVTEEEIAKEALSADDGCPPALLEATALWRAFCHTLPRYGTFLLHAAFLATAGHGVAFAAPSGVGKSTHVALWEDLLGDGCRILNGDKPLIRRGEDGRFLGYGTPFCGKEDRQENASAPLEVIFFLERGDVDAVTPLTESEAFPLLYGAALSPKDADEAALLLPLLSELLSTTRLYRLTCTPRPEAARLAIQTVLSEEYRK